MPKKQAEPVAAPSGHARNWSPEQRRRAFFEARKAQSDNYQVLESDFKEKLTPYNHIVFDKVLGLGGVARHGSVTQFHGDEGAGKTSTAVCTAIAYQQATGEPFAYLDYEGTSSPQFLANCGADTDLVHFIQPTSVEQGIQEHVRLMDEAGIRLFVNDSIPYMDSKVEKKLIMNGKAFKGNYGSHAKSMSRFYKMLSPYTKEYDAALLMINQTRDRIDDSTEAQWANEHSYTNRIYTLPGGRMCRFAPSVMVELTLKKALAPKAIADMEPDELFILDVAENTGKTKPDPTMNLVRARTLKNKPTGAGFRKGDIYIRPGRGWDESVSIRALARSLGFITNSGAKWFVGKSKEEAFATYPNKTEAVQALVIDKDPEVLGKLRSLVYDSVDDNSAMFVAEVTQEERDALDESKSQTFSLNSDDDELA